MNPENKSSVKSLLLALAPTVVVLLLFALGFASCYFFIYKVFDNQFQRDARVYTLGAALKERDRESDRDLIVGAYLDPASALTALDEISWAAPTMPTPFVGSAPVPGRHGSATINTMQFRSQSELIMPKPAGVYRIFVTGGSTAFGSGAPSDQTTIAGYLETLLGKELAGVTDTRYEVFLMANSAWATTQERIVIENLLSELEPDMVISFSGVNDAHWGLRGRNVLWYRSYADEFFLSLLRKVYWLAGQPELPENAPVDSNGITPATVTDRLVKNVRLASFALQDRSVDYVFVLQPTLTLTGKALSTYESKKLKPEDRDYFRQCYDGFRTRLKAQHVSNFRFLDLSGVFDDQGEQNTIFMDSYHFADKGNKIVAEKIFQHIRRQVVAGRN